MAFRIVVLLIAYLNCQVEIADLKSSYQKVDYSVKITETSDSEFNSKYIQFTIQKVNSINDYKYTGLKGYVFIKPEKYKQLLNEAGLKRLEGVQLIFSGNFTSVKKISNPGDKSRIPLNLSNKNLGKLDFNQVQFVNSKYSTLKESTLQLQHNLLDLRDDVHYRIKHQIELLYTSNTNGLLNAMILGDKENLDTSVELGFRKTGTSHIIAISGLHIGMLYLLIGLVINLFSQNLKLKFYIVVTSLFAYNLLIGHNVSAIRATMMIVTYLFSHTFFRTYNKTKSLFFCMVLYLIIFPEGIFSGGFLLSYGAVLGLFCIYPILKSYVLKKTNVIYDLSAGGLIIDLALISLSVNIMTLPILIYLFNGMSLVSIIANIFIVPVVMSFYLLGIISLVVSLILYPIALFIAGTVEVISSYIVVLGKLLSELSFAFMYLKTPNLLIVILYYIVVISLIVTHNKLDIDN